MNTPPMMLLRINLPTHFKGTIRNFPNRYMRKRPAAYAKKIPASNVKLMMLPFLFCHLSKQVMPCPRKKDLLSIKQIFVFSEKHMRPFPFTSCHEQSSPSSPMASGQVRPSSNGPRLSQFSASLHSLEQRHFIRVLQITAHRYSMGDSGNFDA